jgi:hypothetical protein
MRTGKREGRSSQSRTAKGLLSDNEDAAIQSSCRAFAGEEPTLPGWMTQLGPDNFCFVDWPSKRINRL